MSRKRPYNVIDLTGESSPPRARNKQPHLSQNVNASQSVTDDYNSGNASVSFPPTQIGEENEVIDLSQDVNEGFGWTQVGSIDAKIVGIQYYDGYATPGEQVVVKREPQNHYDRNAIRVTNVQGSQIGHIPRGLAARLAPYMDSRSIVVEAVLAGEKGAYDCPILLKLIGPSEAIARERLIIKMQADRLPLKKQRQNMSVNQAPQRKRVNMTGYTNSLPSSSQSTPSSQPEPNLTQLAEHSLRINPRDIDKLAEDFGVSEDKLSKMPMAAQPKNLVSTLLPYQKQGLAFMLDKENPKLPAPGSDEVVQLWKCSSRAGVFQNLASQFSTSTPPTLAKGGILADDMGLGKTLQVISLILEGGPGPTLIVAPVSVMSNWSQQVERHVESNRLKVLTYHGDRRRTAESSYNQYDIVITTYGTLSQELFPKGAKVAVNVPKKDGLFSIKWARVVLDEGHIIRNHQTKAAIAATSLMATSRWILTGTPLVNSIKDFYSMLKFLGITGGLERLELFNAIFTRPLAAGDPQAEILLQTAMRTFCLRRKKDMKFIDLKLPELTEYVHRITFRNDEKEKYDALTAEAKGMVRNVQDGSQGNISTYQHLLEVLLRMRQVCSHWKLCESRVVNLLSLLEKGDVLALNQENILALQTLLQISVEAREECSICLEELHSPVITACKHVFGKECIERTIELQNKCPMCRAHLASNKSLVQPALEAPNEDPEIDVNTKSSKTEALMQILRASRRDPDSKVVIFSQWTSFLNIIQFQIQEAGFRYTRIDGTMSASARDRGISALDNDSECKILLASLSVCSVGLNLVSADTVILADSWWAPAIEDQAVDRVHRLGQTRPCTVWRLVMEDSIEERVLNVQAEKRKLVGKAFREKAKGRMEKAARMGDILKLLG